MLKIGDFSKLTRISIRMLRHYDEIGLLHPTEIDAFTGYRYYTAEQLPTACRINALKDMGFPLSEIKKMLPNFNSPSKLEEHYLTRRHELEKEAAQTAYRLQLLDTALTRLRNGELMNYDVTLKTIPERTAASVRMVIPTYQEEGMLWGILEGETTGLNLIPDDPCLCSAIYHNTEWKEFDVDVEVQKTVKGTYSNTKHVRFITLPAMNIASATYKGSYALIGEVYSAVYAWIEANGYVPAGPINNIYHVSPHETSNPEEFITEVCCPVEKK